MNGIQENQKLEFVLNVNHLIGIKRKNNMPSGIYKRTEEYKRKISEARKGRHLTEEHKRNISLSKQGSRHNFYGKHHSEETKRKMSLAKKGKYLSEETKLKISKIKQSKILNKQVKINCKICNKEKLIYPYLIKSGYGIFCSRRCAVIYRNIHQKKHDTDIERIIENELIRRNIPYTKQVPLLGITLVDFLLPKDIVIYCDGTYWHSLEKAKIKDLNQDFMLTFYGYKVFRFTDKEINQSVNKCIDIVQKHKPRKEELFCYMKGGDKMKDVLISPVLNGWIVTVGCSKVVFDQKTIMLGELSKYIDNPDEVEKKYMEKAVNKCSNEVEALIPVIR